MVRDVAAASAKEPMRASILTLLTTATLVASACQVIGPPPTAAGSQTTFVLPANHILRVHTRGGPAGAERVTALPAAAAERRFTVVYDSADRMLAVAFAGPSGSQTHYFLAPTRFTMLPE
jgi:hypothetical protein